MQDDRHIEVVTTGIADGDPRHHIMWFLWDEPERLHLIWGGPERPSWVDELTADPGCEVRLDDRHWEATSLGATADGPERTDVLTRLAQKYLTARSGLRPGWSEVMGVITLQVGRRIW